MAFVLRLYNTENNIDLISGNGLQAMDEWAPTVMPDSDGYFQEVIPMVIKVQGTAESVVESIVTENTWLIETLLNYARAWRDNPFQIVNAVWFEWQPDGASAQRAVVVDGYLQPLISNTSTPHLRAGEVVRVNLVLKRLGWESDNTRTFGFTIPDGTWFMPYGPFTYADGAEATVPAMGGTLELDTYATKAGRIKGLHIQHVTGNVVSLWAGIHPTTEPESFTAVWEAEIGIRGGQVSLETPDVTASNSKYLQTTFLALNDKAASYRIENIGPTGTEGAGADVLDPLYFGRFLVLMRYRIPSAVSGMVFGVTLEHGVVNKNALEEVIVEADTTASGWNYIELGEVNIPGTILRNGYTGNVYYSFDLQLEQIAGSLTDFDIDCLVVVPSKHMCRVSGANMTSDLEEIVIMTSEDNEVVAIQRLSGGEDVVYTLNPEPRNWFVPPDVQNSVLVVVTTNSASYPAPNDIGDEVGLGIEIVEQWTTWRGRL